MTSLGLALPAAAVLLSACAAAPPPPAEPKSEGPVASAPAPDPPRAPGSAAGSAQAPGAAAAAAAAGSPDPASHANDRVEDMASKKVKSAGGAYTVSVLSAAGLAADEVGKVVNGASGKSDECYAKLFKKQMGVTGHTAFDVTISARGKTAQVKLRGDDMKSPDLEKCLETLVKGLDWPQPTDKAGGKTSIEWVVSGN